MSLSRLLRSASVAALLLLAVLPAGALAARLPSPAELEWRWLRNECVTNPSGQYVAIGRIKTTVKALPYGTKAGERFYQEVKVQVDTLAGYGTASNHWRQISGAAKVYDWTRFGKASVPMFSTSAVRTGLPTGGSMSIKATVWLKKVRTGPDKTVWRSRIRSTSFSCGVNLGS